MSRFVLAVLVLFTAFSSFGNVRAESDGWQPILTLQSGEFYEAVYFDAQTVLASGLGGVLVSHDSGHSWEWRLDTMATSIAAGDSLHAWAGSRDGTIYATADGGNTWIVQRSEPGFSFAVDAFDARNAVAIGIEPSGDIPLINPKSIILRTEDGGSNWQEVTLPDRYQPGSIEVLRGGDGAWIFARECRPLDSASLGCGIGESALFTTSDRGATWTKISSQLPAFMSSMQFASATNGWALSARQLLQTGDGGKSWNVVREWPEGVSPRHLQLLNSNTVILLEDEALSGVSQIVKSADGGKTWTKIGQAARYPSVLQFFDDSHAVRAHIYDQTIDWTDDGGLSWQDSIVPVFLQHQGFNAFDFVDPQNGWFGGSSLLRTRDGGHTWERASELEAEALDFVSSNEGWAVNRDCSFDPCRLSILHTIDGGSTWEQQYAMDDLSNLAKIVFVDNKNGWLVSRSYDFLLHTSDGGLTWRNQPLPPQQVSRIAFAGRNVLWATARDEISGNTIIYRSLDGGDSWQQAGITQPAGDCGPSDVNGVDEMHAWFVSSECRDRVVPWLYRTADGGATWQRIPLGGVISADSLKFFDPSKGVMIHSVCSKGEVSQPCDEVVFSTEDGGQTWTDRGTTGSHGSGFMETVFIDPQHGWFVEMQGSGMMSPSRAVLYSNAAIVPGQAISLPDSGDGTSKEQYPLQVIGLPLLAVLISSILASRLRRKEVDDEEEPLIR